MLRIGIAGIGFMGMVHYLSYQKLRGVKVTALCEREERRLAGDWRGINGNFGPEGTQMDLAGVATYSELDAMLADPRVDAIDITLPPALHAEIAVKALKAGKHVFCEKPMALTAADCHRMAKAAAAAKKQLLIGHVLPYFPEYAWALKEIRSGKHGKLLGGSFKRVISDPAWLKNYWNAEITGGPMLDLHVHDAHFIRLLFGMPLSVKTIGRTHNGLAAHWHTQFDYGPTGPAVAATSGTIPQQGRPFLHGFEIQLERATLVFEFGILGGEGSYLCPPTLIDHRGKTSRPKLADGDPMYAFAAELKDVVRCLTKHVAHPGLGSELALDAIVLCQKQEESLAKGKIVKV